MSTIAAGGVSGMTADVKTLHVKPEAGRGAGLKWRPDCWRYMYKYVCIVLLYIYMYMSVDPLENSCSLLETRSPTFLWHSFFAGLGGGQRPQCGAVLSQGTEKPGGGR